MPETGCSVSTRFVAEGHLERIGQAYAIGTTNNGRRIMEIFLDLT